LEEKKMKRAFSSFATIALIGAMSAVTMAQTGGGLSQAGPTAFSGGALPGGAGGIPGAPAMPPNGGAVGRFDNGYLDRHPGVAQQLARDPSLVDNQHFLSVHPELEQYLAKHPEVRTDLEQHPYRFMQAESRYGHFENNGSAVGRFDNGYLDRHPGVAQQLAKDPSLVDNQHFLSVHPQLEQYLAKHPEVRTNLEQHPGRFMQAEAGYERYDNGQNWHGRWGSHPFRNWRRNHGW
jgi:hypothetical protein